MTTDPESIVDTPEANTPLEARTDRPAVAGANEGATPPRGSEEEDRHEAGSSGDGGHPVD